MAEYYLDSYSLKDLGFEIEKVEGLETIPARKGETQQSWMDSHGIEPFVDEDDIFLKERDITITLLLLSDTIQEALTAIQGLQDILYLPGTRNFTVDYSARNYICYCKDGAETERITGAYAAPFCYRIRVKLVEINPT